MASLKERSKHLTSISLESFIGDILAQGENHNFLSLFTHPNIHTVNPQFQQLLKIYAEGTYEDYLNQSHNLPELNARQTDTLRKLTILTLFKGKQSIAIGKLMRSLRADQNTVIDLLLMMNINGMANVKIDEQKSTVLILKCEIRASSQDQNTILTSRIQHIMQKNKEVESSINSLIDKTK